ncbi:hypothetical protein EV182_004849 [Spiromyces aspiralis]|uniref:Uncharacterized protein n=1 Tax=Spiromyces aspiralis TaxID=68401 RepID=A0ACC1HBU7_9FUNG|nr:hypothetical protein EV182_004849 [Spiromyces aspiralis]
MVSQLRRWDYRIDLSGLPNLEIFEVNGNFNRTLPIVFKTLLTLSAVPQLRSLSFTHAYCPDYAGILVKNFPNLESFRLSNWAMGNDQSRVAGAISVTLRGLPRLREFSVSFMHDFPMALSNADNVFGGARCHSLRRLDIPTTFFHAGSVLGVLSRMFPELEQLSICFSHLATIYRLGRSVRFPKLYKLLVNGAAVNTEMERMHFQNFISRFPCLRLCMILGCQNETIEALKLAFPNIIFWNHS